MADFSHLASDFFRYLVIAFVVDLTMSAMFRATVFITPNAILAEVSCCHAWFARSFETVNALWRVHCSFWPQYSA
jgi:hypothetical protein